MTQLVTLSMARAGQLSKIDAGLRKDFSRSLAWTQQRACAQLAELLGCSGQLRSGKRHGA